MLFDSFRETPRDLAYQIFQPLVQSENLEARFAVCFIKQVSLQIIGKSMERVLHKGQLSNSETIDAAGCFSVPCQCTQTEVFQTTAA